MKKNIDISGLKMIGQGNTAEIYAIEDNKILKLFREGISEKIAVCEYEKAVFVQIYIPNVPKVYECLRVNNRVGIIYERIQGADMITLMIKSLMKTKDYSRKLASYHSEIHKNAVKMEAGFCLKNKLISEVNAVEYINDEQRKSIVDYKGIARRTSAMSFGFSSGQYYHARRSANYY